MNAPGQILSAPPKLSWFQQFARFVLHLLILYGIISFPTGLLTQAATVANDLFHGGTPALFHWSAFILSHLVALTVIPAFLAGLLLNARLRHQAAAYIWIFPLAILAYNFVFHGPGIYPTMLGDSDFLKAFHFYFGAGLPTDVTNVHADWFRLWVQICLTLPLYGAIAYSLGALLGRSAKTHGLQELMQKL